MSPTPPPPAPVETDKSGHHKGRLSGIVESSKQTLDQWQQAVDERIRAILPGLGLFSDLQSDVKRLSERVDELEAKLQALTGGQGETPAEPPEGDAASEPPAEGQADGSERE